MLVVQQRRNNKMKRTIIIAEAGVNHNGSLELARRLVDVAKAAKVDYVKFQTFKTELAITKNAEKAQYQKQTTDLDESQFDMIKKLELGVDAHKELLNYCKRVGIAFLSTPFDHDSVDLLADLGLKIFKIPSGEITNLPYLRHIGSLRKQVILSTGMADIGEIEDALDVLIEAGTKRESISILHANTEYPTPMRDVNLKAMETIGNTFKLKYGYSDHTLGIEVPIAAVAMGASIIEKHFTLDKTMEGPDHKASLEPDELIAMVKAIRNIEFAMGNGIKKPSFSESKNRSIARKSIVAMKDIKKGDLFSENNITTKRPGTGTSPMLWDDIIGKRAAQDFNVDDIIAI